MSDDQTQVDYVGGRGFEWRVSRLRFHLWWWHVARDGEIHYRGFAFRRKTAERKAKLWRDRLLFESVK